MDHSIPKPVVVVRYSQRCTSSMFQSARQHSEPTVRWTTMRTATASHACNSCVLRKDRLGGRTCRRAASSSPATAELWQNTPVLSAAAKVATVPAPLLSIIIYQQPPPLPHLPTSGLLRQRSGRYIQPDSGSGCRRSVGGRGRPV